VPDHIHFYTNRVVTHKDNKGVEHGYMQCICGAKGPSF
jgi:hypothetical protein